MKAGRPPLGPVAGTLSAFVRANSGTVPGPVADEARLHIADCLACMLAGAATPAASAAAALFDGSRDPAAPFAVPGLGRWRDGATAAFVAGICAHAEDFDDTSEYSMNGHPSAPVLGALPRPGMSRRLSRGRAAPAGWRDPRRAC